MYGDYGVQRIFFPAGAGLPEAVRVFRTDNLQVPTRSPARVFRNIFFAMFVIIPLAMTPPSVALLLARIGLRPDERPPALASAVTVTPANESQ